MCPLYWCRIAPPWPLSSVLLVTSYPLTVSLQSDRGSPQLHTAATQSQPTNPKPVTTAVRMTIAAGLKSDLLMQINLKGNSMSFSLHRRYNCQLFNAEDGIQSCLSEVSCDWLRVMQCEAWSIRHRQRVSEKYQHPP